MSIAERVKRNTMGLRLDLDSTGPLEWIGVVLALVTGAVHLYLYWATGFVPFLLAGVGFLGGVGLLFTTFPHRLLYLAGIPFIGVQILLWLGSGMRNPVLGLVDKTVQVFLVGLLLALLLVDLEVDFLEEVGSMWGEDEGDRDREEH